MNTTPTQFDGTQAAQPVLQPGELPRTGNATGEGLATTEHATPRRSGYGLPCAKCKTYYAADLPACPICKATERVTPVIASAPSVESVESAGDQLPDFGVLEEEREQFLRQFKSQVYASHTQINTVASFRCSKTENHPGSADPAAVCQACYDHLQRRVDVLEGALHIDLREAAQLVYDAVWADPSDPSRTYQNAAQALLTEIRKRAGINLVLGPLQPLAH